MLCNPGKKQITHRKIPKMLPVSPKKGVESALEFVVAMV